MAVATKPNLQDGYDLTEEIYKLQARLGELSGELQDALEMHSEARQNVVRFGAAVAACRAELEIKKIRIMSLQSLLKVIPR